MANDTTNYEENIRKVRELIKDIKICMLTSADADGVLRSRPMGTQDAEFDGTLWFLTGGNTQKAHEIESNGQVNVAYQDGNTFVSVAGTAEILYDKKLIHQFWSPFYKAWFPNGEDDPNIRLLKVTADSAEYWDNPNGKVVTLVGFVKGVLTGEPEALGENKTIDLNTQTVRDQQPSMKK